MKTDSTISRLREANPVPRVESADASELFAQITARAPDPRLARRAAYTRPRLVVALVLVGLALLGSSAVAISNWFQGSVVKPPVTRAEYKRAQSRLTLPPGYSWPKLHVDNNSVTSVGAGGGHAVGIAQNAWECYWAKAIRDGDRAAQHRAHAALDSLLANHVIEAPAGVSENWSPPHPPPGPYAVFAHDGGLEWIRAGYRMAAAGNPARIIASCRANMPG